MVSAMYVCILRNLNALNVLNTECELVHNICYSIL